MDGVVARRLQPDRQGVRVVELLVAAVGRRQLAERGLRHPRPRIRRKTVDRDAVASQLLRRDHRERRDPRLRRAVIRLADVAEDSGRARRVEHTRAHLLARLRALAPVRGRVPGRREVPLQVDADHRVPLVLLHVHEHPVAQNSGVVDEDVQPPERFDRLVDEPFCPREVGHVLAVGDRLAV